jgi:hypothetical protein
LEDSRDQYGSANAEQREDPITDATGNGISLRLRIAPDAWRE